MPSTWGECQTRGLGSATPCPFKACRHHLEHGRETCSLQAAEAGPRSNREIAVLVDASVRQVQRDCHHALVLFAGLLLEYGTRRTRRVRAVARSADVGPLDLEALPELAELPHGHGPVRRLTDEQIRALYPGVALSPERRGT